MKTSVLTATVALVLICSLSLADQPREADAILKEYQAVKMPVYESAKRDDQDYIRTYMDARNKSVAKQNELALELYGAYPSHQRATELMMARWNNMRGNEAEKAAAEMEQFLKDWPDSPRKKDVLYTRAMIVINTIRPDMLKVKGQEYTEDFIQAFPSDERGAGLLSMIAMRSFNDKPLQLTIYRRIATDYAGTRSAKMAEGSIRRADAVGQPFELTFTDAMNGQTVSMKALNGKVVVVDFWATWCGPCIAEMPKMKELYGKYKDQGVEFIGVSLDAPGDGLEKLKKYVEENGIQWPQYYQGNAWDSEFSLSWGINGIPALFVVDAEGNLFSTEARSRLDTIIPELIKKRDSKS